MLDEGDHRISPSPGVVDREIVAVDAQKVPQRLKSRALITFFECMRPSDAGDQHDPKHEDILVSEAEEIRGRANAPSSRLIPGEVSLARCFHFEPVVLDHASIGSQLGSFGKGRSDLGKSRHKLSAQRFMVDFPLHPASTQDLAGNHPPLSGKSLQLIVQILKERQPGDGNREHLFNAASDCRIASCIHSEKTLPQSFHRGIEQLPVRSLLLKGLSCELD